jgi:hypothetical protein
MPMDAKTLSLGPGLLYWAPAGTADPTTAVTASVISDTLPVAWKQIGYTDAGSEFAYELTSDDVPVAEVFDPITHKTTGRSGTVSFEMAEITVKNLVLALNGGTVTNTGTTTTAMWTYEPPNPGSEVRVALIWQSEDMTERWLFRQVFQTGSVTVGRRRGADKATIPVAFALEAPGSGVRPFKVWMATDNKAGGQVVQP